VIRDLRGPQRSAGYVRASFPGSFASVGSVTPFVFGPRFRRERGLSIIARAAPSRRELSSRTISRRQRRSSPSAVLCRSRHREKASSPFGDQTTDVHSILTRRPTGHTPLNAISFALAPLRESQIGRASCREAA